MDYILNFVIGLIIAGFFYWLGKRNARRILSELKSYTENQTAYLERLIKQLEAQGTLRVVQDSAGKPADVQIVRTGSKPSKGESYGPVVSLGLPPKPPRQLNLSAPLQLTATISSKVIRRDGSDEHS